MFFNTFLKIDNVFLGFFCFLWSYIWTHFFLLENDKKSVYWDKKYAKRAY